MYNSLINRELRGIYLMNSCRLVLEIFGFGPRSHKLFIDNTFFEIYLKNFRFLSYNLDTFRLTMVDCPLRKQHLPLDICPKYFAQFYFANLDICPNEICSKRRRHLPMETIAQFQVSKYHL